MVTSFAKVVVMIKKRARGQPSHRVWEQRTHPSDGALRNQRLVASNVCPGRQLGNTAVRKSSHSRPSFDYTPHPSSRTCKCDRCSCGLTRVSEHLSSSRSIVVKTITSGMATVKSIRQHNTIYAKLTLFSYL